MTGMSLPLISQVNSQEINWTHQCEVLVVGGGGAGLTAAARAGELKSDVILLEKNSVVGGNALISGGFLGVVDPVRQEPLGIHDSPERHFRDIWENGGKIGNRELIWRLVEESPRMLSWMESKGVKFQNNVIEILGSHFPRCHKPVFPHGSSYIRALTSSLMKDKVRIFTSVKATDLIKDSSGRVVGVKAQKGKEEFFIHAEKGVILATGGFGSNKSLVEKFDSRLTGLPTNCSSGSTGEILFVAAKIGVTTVDLKEIQCLPGPLPGGKIRVRFHNDVSRFILIDDQGNEFADTQTRRDILKEKILSTANKSCFCIIDNNALNSYDLLVQRDAIRASESGDAFKAHSIEELAIKIGVPPENLVQTIQNRNRAIAELSPLVRKYPIDKPPFWAARIGMRIHYTMGGLVINRNAQCLASGKPVPGLFAAGEITGGIHGKNRIGGNGLADAFTYGLIAAESVVIGIG